jgi:hypothetical protein
MNNRKKRRNSIFKAKGESLRCLRKEEEITSYKYIKLIEDAGKCGRMISKG